MNAEKPTISAFFPFLNDWGTIGSLVAVLDWVLAGVTSDYEIIIVDDGSDEKSKDMLRMLGNKFPKLRITSHKKNRGYGAAIKTGIAESRMEWVFYTDGDAQYDPRDLKYLLNKMTSKTDIVNGYKIKREDPWYRIILGKFYHYLAKFLFNLPIRDVDCDFRLMRKSIFKKVKLESNSGIICVEMIKKIHDMDFRFAEVPVHHYWRTSGKSQFFNFKRVARVIVELFVLWYRLVIRREHLRGV